MAGPSGAAEIRRVSDSMLAFGAEQVLIDGAIDRRAASSPEVADGLLMSTGAILSEQIEEVVARTAEAVELVRLPTAADTERLAQLARSPSGEPNSVLLGPGTEALELAPRFVLTADAPEVRSLLGRHPGAERLLLGGALPEAFVRDLALALRPSGRRITLVVADPTKVFLYERGAAHYARLGVSIETLRGIDLRALTVNPQAPQSHSFDSGRLRSLLGEAIADLEIFDVMHPSYAAAGTMGIPAGGRTPG